MKEIDLDKVIAVIPTRFDASEISKWVSGKFFGDFTKDVYKLGKYNIYIDSEFDVLNISVRGYNGTNMGYMRLDNCYHGDQIHSLCIKFINKLSMIDPASNYSSILNTTLYLNRAKFGDECHFTFRMILSLIEESWNQIFNYHK